MEFDEKRFIEAREKAEKELLNARTDGGFWKGRLASSALATSVAVSALEVVHREYLRANQKPPFDYSLVERGIEWLSKNVNPDGGWGDTTLSKSNISTTTLCWCAFYIVNGAAEKYKDTVWRAEKWLRQHAGRIEPHILVPTIVSRYGNDRTFSAPILMVCAIANRIGSENEAWRLVPQLPFEVAILPRDLFALLKVPVVSYALPALVAIGQARHAKAPSGNKILNLIRNALREKTLELVFKIQPPHGGFLEAIPLTSFVALSLTISGNFRHPIVSRAISFIKSSVRGDGSWAIDTDLATWLTTLSINALFGENRRGDLPLDLGEINRILRWILNQQHKETHLYTNAVGGGWAWTNLPGGVPDADDTAGALIAIQRIITKLPGGKQAGKGQFQNNELAETGISPIKPAIAGVNWLVNLQNSDGGIPTFCRGWGHLPFDRSGADLTAHALRAWTGWLMFIPPDEGKKIIKAAKKAVEFLIKAQSETGYWEPLWFGNQDERHERNLTYGTSRVLLGLQAMLRFGSDNAAQSGLKGVKWLIEAQSEDGGWSGFKGGKPSVEETAWAVEALCRIYSLPICGNDYREKIMDSASKGVNWLCEKVLSGEWKKPSPIGFYFARLWYYEELYPIIFTVSAFNSFLSVMFNLRKSGSDRKP